LLPGRFRLVRAAAAACTAPHCLAISGVVPIERQSSSSAYGSHVLRGSRILNAIAAVAGGEGNRLTRDVEVAVIRAGGLTGKFAATPRVGDHVRVRLRIVFCSDKVGERVRVRFDQQDAAVGAQGVGDLDVERDLQRPARVFAWIVGPARLIDLLKTTVSGGAGRKSVGAAVHREVALNVGIIIGVHDANGLGGTCARGKAVRGPELYWAIPGWRSRGFGAAVHISGHVRMTACGTKGSWPGTNRPGTRSHRRG